MHKQQEAKWTKENKGKLVWKNTTIINYMTLQQCVKNNKDKIMDSHSFKYINLGKKIGTRRHHLFADLAQSPSFSIQF